MVCDLFLRNDAIHLVICLPMPSDSAFVRRMEWSTLSNALLKSRSMASVCPLLLSILVKSLAVVMS